MLHECNPFVREFKSVHEKLADHDEGDVVEFEVKYIENDSKVYNAPRASELMVVLDDHERSEDKHGLRLLAQNRVECEKAVIIWDCNREYEPLHFVMLYPRGTAGWNSDMNLSVQGYAAYLPYTVITAGLWHHHSITRQYCIDRSGLLQPREGRIRRPRS